MEDRETLLKRIWVISELYYPEDTSTGYYLTRIAEGLADRTATPVHVLCGRPTYAARGQKTPATEVHRDVQIQRCWSTTFNKDRLPLRVVNLLTLCLSMLWHAAWQFRRGDRVLVVTNPPLLPFVISFICRLRGAVRVVNSRCLSGCRGGREAIAAHFDSDPLVGLGGRAVVSLDGPHHRVGAGHAGTCRPQTAARR